MPYISPAADEWAAFPDINLSAWSDPFERQQMALIYEWGRREQVAPDPQGSAIEGVTRVTTTYTVLTTDRNVFCDTDGGAFTVTLPAGVAGQTFKIMNTGTSANDLTVTPSGSELLIGVNSSFTLRDGESLDLVYEPTEGWA